MIYIIGVYLLFLSILMDDASTYLLFMKGLGAFETNPLYIHFGIGVMFLISIIAYAVIIFSWGQIIKIYSQAYKNKTTGHRLFDVVVFMMCFVLIFMTFTKMELGFENIKTLTNSFDEKKNMEYKVMVKQIDQAKVENVSNYIAVKQNQYIENVLVGMTYFKSMIVMLFSYLLFRVGFKVVPYEFA
jgi:hypothetical protein